MPCERPNGAAGAPFAVVQPFAESKRDDPTHRELQSRRGTENPAREGMEETNHLVTEPELRTNFIMVI